MKRLFLTAACLAAGLFAFALAACGDDGGDDHSADSAAVLSAIAYLDKAGLHDLDVSINEKNEIPASARNHALKLQAVTLITEWPDDLESEAKALATIFGDLAKALDGDKPDAKVAGPLAKKAHDGQHDFSEKVWTHLKEEAGLAATAGTHKD